MKKRRQEGWEEGRSFECLLTMFDSCCAFLVCKMTSVRIDEVASSFRWRSG